MRLSNAPRRVALFFWATLCYAILNMSVVCTLLVAQQDTGLVVMPVTDRMLIGAIAGNPASFEGTGEYRFCRTCGAIFFTSARKPDAVHSNHDWFALPALNPDGSNKLSTAFKRYVTRWSPERQEELEQFALKKGWDMAMELKYGGGALDDDEAAEWQEIVNIRLEQLMRQTRELINNGTSE